MLSQTCARRELAALSDGLGRFAGTSEGILFGRYARLVGAPNCAPSLRSVAGLLLALALQSAYEDTLTSLHRFVTEAALRAAFVGWCCPVGYRSVSTNPVSGAPPAARSAIITVRPVPPASATLLSVTTTLVARTAGSVPAGTARTWYVPGENTA